MVCIFKCHADNCKFLYNLLYNTNRIGGWMPITNSKTTYTIKHRIIFVSRKRV